MGCVWIVFRHGASAFASSDGSISPAGVAPMSSSTSGSFGCTGVFVMRCQKTVRCEDVRRQRRPRRRRRVRSGRRATSCAGAIVGSVLWTMFGSSYVPGTLALIGSPLPDVLKMMYCALLWLAHAGRRGLRERLARVEQERRGQAGGEGAQADAAGAEERGEQSVAARDVHRRIPLLTSRSRRPSATGTPRRTSTGAPRWR